MTIKLNIGKPKEPTKSLADQLKVSATPSEQKDMSTIASPLKMSLEVLKKVNTQDTQMDGMPMAESTIPPVTNTKYSLLVDSTDTLPQKTIDQFNQRMQYLEAAFDNTELPDAMQRVMEYCQEHQELRPFLRAEDIGLFVRGARSSYARVAEVKIKNRKKLSKNAVLEADIMESLGDIEIDL